MLSIKAAAVAVVTTNVNFLGHLDYVFIRRMTLSEEFDHLHLLGMVLPKAVIRDDLLL